MRQRSQRVSAKERLAMSPEALEAQRRENDAALEKILKEPTTICLEQPGAKRIVQLADGTPRLRTTRSVFTKYGRGLVGRAAATAIIGRETDATLKNGPGSSSSSSSQAPAV